MPIQSDSTRPVKTINADGSTTTTNNQGEPITIKQVDKIGRQFEPLDTSTLIAKHAPDAKEEPKKELPRAADGTFLPADKKEEQPANPEAEARKLFLSAQKAERKAKEMEKKAKSGLDKAQAIEAAIELTKSGKDPVAVLTAAGLDPIKFYQDMTTHALKTPETPEDPVQKQLRQQQEKLDQYAKDLEVQAITIREKEELANHNKAISESVIPLLQNNPDKYEALLTEYGPNAAVQIYKTLWERYQQLGHTNDDDGVPLTFERVADSLEDYWSKQIESGIIAASKLKKFANRFAQETQTPRNTTEKPKETPASFTLSNQHNSPAPTKIVQPFRQEQTWEERANEIVKRYGK